MVTEAAHLCNYPAQKLQSVTLSLLLLVAQRLYSVLALHLSLLADFAVVFYMVIVPRLELLWKIFWREQWSGKTCWYALLASSCELCKL
jgi:hypothetical protein